MFEIVLGMDENITAEMREKAATVTPKASPESEKIFAAKDDGRGTPYQNYNKEEIPSTLHQKRVRESPTTTLTRPNLFKKSKTSIIGYEDETHGDAIKSSIDPAPQASSDQDEEEDGELIEMDDPLAELE